MSGAAARITRDGDVLRVSGALVRAHVAALWAQRPADAAGVRRVDLTGVERIDSATLARPARRPAYSVLSNLLFEHVTGHRLPHWQEAVDRYLGLGAAALRAPEEAR